MYSKAVRAAACYFLCIFAGVALSGCGLFGSLKLEERESLPVPLEISLGAAEGVNPNIEGRPSPIVVRLFELSNDTRFMGADYFELMGQNDTPLGDELLVSEEFILLPGEVRMVRKRAAANSKFLGIIAGYRDLTGSTWRAVASLPEPYLAGRVWSSSVSPTKRLYVVLGEQGVAIYEEQPRQ
ncbi:MAG: type VI secretion system lipoprotein TssJ [Azoarcus sp.]|nr:type VI secretion system lipoprotein TssJ [Azoarcus sp.]